MGMHRDLQMQKVLQATILSVEFIIIITNNKFDKSVRYIHDNKLWERYYVLIRIMFTCLKILCFANINHAGMEKSLSLFKNEQSVH